MGSCLALAEGDVAQAAIHAVNFLPGVGPALVKGINKAEHLALNIDKHRGELENIPLIGPTITGLVGGKRFSTRATIRNKWRTQRRRLGRL